jgi:flagellar biosynthesis protein FlhF
MPDSDQKRNLHVKSFFATSVQEAIRQAREELGPDALLLSSREAPAEARHLGSYEVVFGGWAQLPGGPGNSSSPSDLEAIRQRMDQIQRQLASALPSPNWQQPRTWMVEQALIAADVSPELAREIAAAAALRAGRHSVLPISGARASDALDGGSLAAEVAAEIAARFEVSPELGRVTALVGPPGCGKTTTLVKLAVAGGLVAGRPVRLISTDAYRIGGAEQLRTYAAILGASFQAVEGTTALAHAIETAPTESLVLIDTPGWSAPILKDLGGELAAFLSSRQDIDTHLVLTASMRLADLRQISDQYAVFRPAKLIFTRLDETTSCVSAFCEAVRQARPLSFFSDGQAVPEDLEEASKQRVAESLVRQLPQSMQAVA